MNGVERDASKRSGEGLGVLAAILSSSIGGITTAVTRYVIGATDPVTLAGMRFGFGFLLLLPIALALKSRWPNGRDWLGVAMLGVLFFAVFFGLYNLSLKYTSAARGALALSTLPLMTMLVASALRVEPLTKRKSVGVLIAIGGVAVSLVASLEGAPPGAWRGDAVMVAGTLCMALYSIWSRPFITRSSSLGFVTAGMGFGSFAACLFAWAGGGFASTSDFGAGQWAAVVYIGTLGAALTFFLWVFALARTTPTKVTNTITLNPLTAAIVATFLVGEPIGFDLLIGIAAVFTGILVASADWPRDRPISWRARISRSADILLAWRRRAAERRNLAYLGDRYRKDMGLSRSDAMRHEAELMERFWRR